jgi:hypothetical protein
MRCGWRSILSAWEISPTSKGDPLIKSQLFIRNRFFHASANTRPAVRDCVMM